MTDETPVSGNRWENPDETATPAEPASPAVTERRSLRDRVRPVVAGAVAAAAVVAGVGGFAVGRATASDEGDGRFDQQQVGVPPGGLDGDGRGTDRDGDGDHGFPGGPGGSGGGFPGGPGDGQDGSQPQTDPGSET